MKTMLSILALTLATALAANDAQALIPADCRIDDRFSVCTVDLSKDRVHVNVNVGQCGLRLHLGYAGPGHSAKLESQLVAELMDYGFRTVERGLDLKVELTSLLASEDGSLPPLFIVPIRLRTQDGQSLEAVLKQTIGSAIPLHLTAVGCE